MKKAALKTKGRLTPLVLSMVVVAGAAGSSLAQQSEVPARNEKTDWSAFWIYRDGDQVGNIWSSYRKKVSLPGQPTSVIARIAVDSKYWLWINGQLAIREGGLKRGPTRNDTYYDEVDLTEFFQEGENTIAALVWYWGRSGFSHLDSGQGGFLFEADIDGQLVVSDGSWKVNRQLAFWWSGPPTPNFRLSEYNIAFDARNDIPGWTAPEFDDTEWPNAMVVAQPPNGPWGRLFRRPIPLWRDYGLKEYENAASIPEIATGDTIDAVLPYNAQITPYFEIEAPEGLKIDIRTDHYEVVSHASGNVYHTVRTEYVTREGRQEFESPAWMGGHEVRYHFPAGIRILSLKYRETGYDADFTGWFKSSSSVLDRLWIKAQRTNYVTMRDYFMETAGRERKQATADGTIAIISALYSFDDRARGLMEKFWWEQAAWQLPDGTLLTSVPGNSEIEFASINLFAFGELGLWEYYLHTGDIETLTHLYPAVRKYLLLYPMLANGLVSERLDVTPTNPDNSQPDGYDHLDNVDGPLMANGLYQLALRGAVKMAAATGHDDDIAEWERRMKSIETSVNQLYWRGGWYASDDHNGPPDDRGNALAVLAGFLDGLEPPDDAGDELLSRNYHRIQAERIVRLLSREMHASPQYELRAIEALFRLGDSEAALDRMVQRYQTMADDPRTTLWEVWSPDAGSFNHEYGTGPISLLSGYVAGIKPSAPGYSALVIEPQIGGLSLVDAGVETDKGLVSVRVESKETSGPEEPAISLWADIPEDAACVVGIPKPVGILSHVAVGDRFIWQNGVGLASVTGIRFLEETRTHLRFEVDPGDREFRVYLKPAPARFDRLDVIKGAADATLSWTTYKEVNNLGFEVEQRVNGDFEQFAFVDGAGSVNEERHYSLTIPQATPGVHTYRVKAIGSDGTFSFSDHAELVVPLPEKLTASAVFPNPLDNGGTLVLATQENAFVQADIVNTLGQRVRRIFEDYVSPGEQYHVRISGLGLSAGTYAIRVVSADRTLFRRFTVVK